MPGKERIFNHFVYVDENKAIKLKREQFIADSFITTNDKSDKLHTGEIWNILNKKGFKLNIIHVGKIFNKMDIGMYNKNCNINSVKKSGFEYIKYIGQD